MPRWDLQAPQPEICQICGNVVDNRSLVEPDVEGLRGFRICRTHRFERVAAFAPSRNDYRAMSVLPFDPEAGTRQEPTGLAPWYAVGYEFLQTDPGDRLEYLQTDPGDLTEWLATA